MKKKIEKRSISSIAKACFVSTKRCSMGSVNGYHPLNKIRQTNRCWKWMDQRLTPEEYHKKAKETLCSMNFDLK